MKNAITLTGLMLALLGFVGMMRIKTEVQTMDGERRALVNQRAELRETKRVLEAEWALLASPERLQALAAKAGRSYVNGSALSQIPFTPTAPTSATAPTPTTATAQAATQTTPVAAGLY